MTTPICDFVRRYEALRPIRLHMPGHKQGTDITEIPGADVLYAAEGIIRESEDNAAALFQSRRTLYSAEGSSLCIRAMLYLAQMHAALQGRRARIAAAGPGAGMDRGERLAAAVPGGPECAGGPVSLAADSPDGGVSHHAGLSRKPDGSAADRRDLSPARGAAAGGQRPWRLSALSAGGRAPPDPGGGSLLRLGAQDPAGAPPALAEMGERAMALFASTSPSYQILASLDAVNRLLAEDYPARILETADRVGKMKTALIRKGWRLVGTEPLKLTLAPKSYGWLSGDLAAVLRENSIYCEFFDEDYLVMMVSPENSAEELRTVSRLLLSLPRRSAITALPPAAAKPERVLTPHEALMRPFESVPAEKSLGRILASPSVSCPPAVPILVCGERIDEQALELFRYYGITKCDVVK